MKKTLTYLMSSLVGIMALTPRIAAATDKESDYCEEIAENVEYVKLFCGFLIYSTSNIERNHYGAMLKDSGFYLRDRKSIETFLRELHACPFEKNLEKDVYDVDCDLNIIPGVLIGPMPKEEPCGYAIIRWKCREPELIWLLPGKIYRGAKQFKNSSGIYEFIFNKYKLSDQFNDRRKNN